MTVEGGRKAEISPRVPSKYLCVGLDCVGIFELTEVEGVCNCICLTSHTAIIESAMKLTRSVNCSACTRIRVLLYLGRKENKDSTSCEENASHPQDDN